jgi:hypothetical protein
VALVSAKINNAEDRVIFATNYLSAELPNTIRQILEKNRIEILTIPFDRFRFEGDYLWALAFYKLCVLSYLCESDADNICYLDSDVFIQGSFAGIWNECKYNVMLYDVDHGLFVKDYGVFCDEVNAFYVDKEQLITQYGGEFFAANKENATEFVKRAQNIFEEMQERAFVTSKGDEFILSLAAHEMKCVVKNAGAYIYRYWTDSEFRLVSSNYKYNSIVILHLPAEKNRGMIKLYNYLIREKELPSKQKSWRICRVDRVPIIEQIKQTIKKLLLNR